MGHRPDGLGAAAALLVAAASGRSAPARPVRGVRSDHHRPALRWANPAAVLGLGWLIVSVGYVYGTLYVIIVGVATIIDCGLARQWRGALRVVGVGVFCGLLAVTVYLREC